MREITIFILCLIPLKGFTQTNKEFTSTEVSFFSSCVRKFEFIKQIHSEPYIPVPPRSFPPSTRYLYIELKNNFPNKDEFLRYVKNVRNRDIIEITGKYTTLYVKHFESQLQIILILTAEGYGWVEIL